MADTPPRAFDDLIAEAEAVSADGWDFSWLAGRATEERPSWGYARSLADRISGAEAVLDLDTGGGEVLAEAVAASATRAAGSTRATASTGSPGQPEPPTRPRAPTPMRPQARLTVATEAWPPNVTKAAARLRPLGVAVIATSDEPPLPFADSAFDLVVSRHPVRTWWDEIARVLRPGGMYFSQEVGPASVFELVEHFLGPLPPEARSSRDPERAARAARAAGLDIVDLRTAALRTEFHDIGAVVYFLRKVIWMVPDFSVERYRPQLAALHRRIEAEGPFVATTTRFLVEAVKPFEAVAP
ncbi:methyltransferase domain-containing protein [Streptomyces sp. NPDC088725]|uniref:methyltransferase domain-containing protein n=1 Tax=Streptomyces sp. NPDC088725 TaxID=3365873 RepID=UPI0038185B1A